MPILGGILARYLLNVYFLMGIGITSWLQKLLDEVLKRKINFIF